MSDLNEALDYGPKGIRVDMLGCESRGPFLDGRVRDRGAAAPDISASCELGAPGVTIDDVEFRRVAANG
jgi:hypothetical protein